VKRCIDEGLVGGDGFAVDASLIRAEANRAATATIRPQPAARQ
jgi:transposase